MNKLIIEVFERKLNDELEKLEPAPGCEICEAYMQGAQDAINWIKTGQSPPSEQIESSGHIRYEELN